MQKSLYKLIEVLFPKVCFGCGRVGSYLCGNCKLANLSLRHEVKCCVCGEVCSRDFIHQDCAQYSYLDGVVAVAEYSGMLKELIATAKYKFGFNVLPELAELLCAKLLSYPQLLENSVVSFVPSSLKREKWRGFNQAEVLAQELSKRTGLPCIALLEKIKETDSQAGLSGLERRRNLQGSFVAKEDAGAVEQVSGFEQVLLVDDVFTTGATLQSCAKTLKQAYPKAKVYGVVLASR